MDLEPFFEVSHGLPPALIFGYTKLRVREGKQKQRLGAARGREQEGGCVLIALQSQSSPARGSDSFVCELHLPPLQCKTRRERFLYYFLD